MISALVKWLFACAQATSSDIDYVGQLPAEISSTIFRYLDAESLTAAASVNHRWNSICKSDTVLQRKIRRRLRQERKGRIEAYMKPSKAMKIVRSTDVPTVQFGIRNGNVSIQNLAVKYEAPKPMKNSQASHFKISMKFDGRKHVPRTFPNLKRSKINVMNNQYKVRNLRM